MADATYRTETRKLMVEEQRPTLDVPGDVDLVEYADMLLKRFAKLSAQTPDLADCLRWHHEDATALAQLRALPSGTWNRSLPPDPWCWRLDELHPRRAQWRGL